jgi:uncharacterized protein (DUF1015 family)
MVDVQPLRGLRYVGELAGDLAHIVAPPYDVVSSEEQMSYYERSPYNVIRLEFGREYEGDTPLNNRYSRAAQTLARWLAAGVLCQEREACFYLYRQVFQVNARPYTRTALVARVRLEPFDSRSILPHERTMSKPLDDRLKLLRATQTNLSPIMCLYRDPQGFIRNLLSHPPLPPVVQISAGGNEEQSLSRVNDPALATTIRDFFAPLRLYIADGHHRYQTALNNREEVHKQRGPLTGDAVNFVLMALSDVDDPGLVILPTHRTLTRLASHALQALSSQNVSRFFELRRIEQGTPLDVILTMLAQSGRLHPSLVLVTQADTWLLALGERGKTRLKAQGHSPAWNDLEVAVAQTLLLEELLGLSPEAMVAGEHVGYTHNAEHVLQAVYSRQAQVGILLNAVPVKQLCEVVDAGELLPQKTTYFYPKLMTGLVMNPLRE